MFQYLNEKDMQVVLSAMEPAQFEAGQAVIQQGADGNCIYVVESGELDCTKTIAGEEKFLKSYGESDVFGELALLYNTKRAASINAKTAVKLWTLDRDTFNHIVKDSARKQRERYESFLAKVPLLKPLDAYERSLLCDAFTEATYKEGDVIIKEGDEGHLFYLIESGKASVTKILNGTNTEVMSYSEGDYFGERALLTNEARAATVTATSDCQLACMERKVFQRLMGPLEDLMKNKLVVYDEINSKADE